GVAATQTEVGPGGHAGEFLGAVAELRAVILRRRATAFAGTGGTAATAGLAGGLAFLVGNTAGGGIGLGRAAATAGGFAGVGLLRDGAVALADIFADGFGGGSGILHG